jgi:hypothetical protein
VFYTFVRRSAQLYLFRPLSLFLLLFLDFGHYKYKSELYKPKLKKYFINRPLEDLPFIKEILSFPKFPIRNHTFVVSITHSGENFISIAHIVLYELLVYLMLSFAFL